MDAYRSRASWSRAMGPSPEWAETRAAGLGHAANLPRARIRPRPLQAAGRPNTLWCSSQISGGPERAGDCTHPLSAPARCRLDVEVQLDRDAARTEFKLAARVLRWWHRVEKLGSAITPAAIRDWTCRALGDARSVETDPELP